MKKIILPLSMLFLGLFAAKPTFASIDLCPQSGNFNALCDFTADKAGGIIGQVIQILLVIAVVVCVFYLIWGAIRWILSQGDKAKIDAARQHIIAAIIGLIISFLAFFIVGLVGHFFGVNVTNLSLPQIHPCADGTHWDGNAGAGNKGACVPDKS